MCVVAKKEENWDIGGMCGMENAKKKDVGCATISKGDGDNLRCAT